MHVHERESVCVSVPVLAKRGIVLVCVCGGGGVVGWVGRVHVCVCVCWCTKVNERYT